MSILFFSALWWGKLLVSGLCWIAVEIPPFELMINLVSGNLLSLVSGHRNSLRIYFPEKKHAHSNTLACVIRTIQKRTKLSFPFFDHQTNLACKHRFSWRLKWLRKVSEKTWMYWCKTNKIRLICAMHLKKISQAYTQNLPVAKIFWMVPTLFQRFLSNGIVSRQRVNFTQWEKTRL